ncbi:hypothetical protein [Solibacillus sp. CAU 1738]|uniref:hypothetical protein n=1 Tax=Solibacillus sp. CAU 1738 TaxID=3140363 RepID=UPI003260B542
MTKTQDKILISVGSILLLFTLTMMYMDFIVPKIGPIGSGKRHWTTYATYTSSLLGAICFTSCGIIGWFKLKDKQ